jgi:ribosomal protein S18 acetylase RimI-like enzyme
MDASQLADLKGRFRMGPKANRMMMAVDAQGVPLGFVEVYVEGGGYTNTTTPPPPSPPPPPFRPSPPLPTQSRPCSTGMKYGLGPGVPLRDLRPYLANLAVRPACRRLGVGKLLVSTALVAHAHGLMSTSRTYY